MDRGLRGHHGMHSTTVGRYGNHQTVAQRLAQALACIGHAVSQMPLQGSAVSDPGCVAADITQDAL